MQQQAHIDKAERLLGWARVWLDELRGHGRYARVKDAERVLFAALGAIASSHDALASAAHLMGQRAWCEQLHQTQSRDPLLRYLWLAQHIEASDTLVKWARSGRTRPPRWSTRRNCGTSRRCSSARCRRMVHPRGC